MSFILEKIEVVCLPLKFFLNYRYIQSHGLLGYLQHLRDALKGV